MLRHNKAARIGGANQTSFAHAVLNPALDQAGLAPPRNPQLQRTLRQERRVSGRNEMLSDGVAFLRACAGLADNMRLGLRVFL